MKTRGLTAAFSHGSGIYRSTFKPTHYTQSPGAIRGSVIACDKRSLSQTIKMNEFTNEAFRSVMNCRGVFSIHDCSDYELEKRMKTVLAFGDSNTWGLIPGTKERYSREIRWTGILQDKCISVRIIEEGLCGRTTVFEDELRPGRKGAAMLPVILESQYPLDAAIVMLGTNDCKSIYSVSAAAIGKGIEACLDAIQKYIPSHNILLISPILLGEDVWNPDKDPDFDRRSVGVCRQLKSVYHHIAKERGTAFLAASDYVCADDADSEHMNEDGHCIFEKTIVLYR